MPERITIEGLHIDDSEHPSDYKGPAIFADFNPENSGESYVEKFPYVITREVILRNVTVSSGKTLRISDNPSCSECEEFLINYCCTANH
jgi:hypothetical protein